MPREIELPDGRVLVIPDGTSPDQLSALRNKLASKYADISTGAGMEQKAQAQAKSTSAAKVKPFEWSGPAVPRPPGGGEEAMLAEGAPPALEGLSTIGTAGAIKSNPIATLRAIAGAGAGAYGGGHAGRYIGELLGAPQEGAAIGALGGSLLGGAAGARGIPMEGKGTLMERIFARETPKVVEPSPFEGATSTAKPVGSAELPPATGAQTPFPRIQTRSEINAANRAQAAAVKTAEKAQAAAEKAATKAPSNPFAGMTSSASPAGGAELPAVPQGQATPFPVVGRKGTMPTPPSPETGGPLDITQPKTSLLSRGRTVIQPGMEPDMSNPAHVKMINDYQTISGPKLRELAGAGDRFAAFVLRHMPRP